MIRMIEYLLGGIPTALKNMSSSVGIVTFPTEWKNKVHVPNHQPAINGIHTHTLHTG